MAAQCHYELHVKTVKEEMVKRIKTLELENAELQGSVKQKDQWIEEILRRLKEDERGAEAIEKLKKGHTYEQVIDFLGRPMLDGIERLSPTTENSLTGNIVKRYESMMHGAMITQGLSERRWTSVIEQTNVIHHLMALYFAWVHPVHMLFSEKYFMSTLRCSDPTDTTYCTPAMINAICAMGCNYFDGGDQEEGAGGKLGAQFLEQARRELTKEDPKKPTYSIAYAIIFLVEMSVGEARKASSHLRLAVEMLREADKSSYASEAFEIAGWGIHTLNM